MTLDNNPQKYYTDKTTIKNWFKTGLKPTQSQFWATWDSYWHKDENIPISSIANLGNLLDGKAETNHTHTNYATKEALDNEIVERARVDALKLNKPTTNATSDYVLLADGSTLPKSDFGKVDKVMGVAPDANKNVDISGVAMNWTNAQQRMSALVSKHNDATYNRLLGMDAQGNIDEVGIYAMTSEMSISTDAQKDAWRLANQKSTETNYSIKPLITMVDIVSIPNGITYPININISGVNLNMVQTVNLVKVRDENGSPIIEESVKIETFTRVSATLITVSLPPNIMTNGWVVFEVTDNFISASRSEMLELTNNVRPITPPIITDWEYIGDATRDKSRDSFNANKVTLLTGTAANAGILNRAKYKANFKITLDMIDKGFEVTIKTTGTDTPVYGQGQIVPSLSIVDSNNNFIYQIDRNISQWSYYNIGMDIPLNFPV